MDIRKQMIEAEHIANALGKASSSGEGWITCCPAHDDEHPSLSITDTDDGRVLVHCHAGCSQDEVIGKLKELNLWTDESQGEYSYVNKDGNMLYQVVRFPNKEFRHRQPDGNGGWVWNVTGVEKVPYRLPDLTAALNLEQTIFIVEGEKDCETLASHGFIATTNSGGAGKWSDELSQYLKGAKEVAILPDNDKPGYSHAQEVANSLIKLGIPVKVVSLPNLLKKGDVSDWLDAGGTKEQLLEICSAAAYWTFTEAAKVPKDKGSRTAANEESIDWSNPEAFGEAILFDQIETPEITSDFLPSWVKDYADALAEETQTPSAMASMLAPSVLAACVQKKFAVHPYGNTDGYVEPLSLWTLVALPPATRKSAVLGGLTEPIIDWEQEKEVQLQDELRSRNTQRDVLQKRIDDLKKQASKYENIDTATREHQSKSRLEIFQEIEQLEKELPEAIQAPKIFVTDVTPEGLQMELAENGGRSAIISDEGNLFEIMAGLYSEGRSNLDVFLQGHSGGTVRVKRNSRDVYLNNIAVTIGLAIQPQILRDFKNGSKQSFRGKGLLARFLFCMPKSNIGHRNVRQRKSIPPKVKVAYRRGIKHLLNTPTVRGEYGEEVRGLELDDEARELYLDFCQSIENQQGDGGKFEYMQDFTGKLPGQLLRIAGICHVAAQAEEIVTLPPLSSSSSLSHQYDFNTAISKDTLTPIIELGKKLIVHAQAALDLIQDNEAIADAKKSLNWILTNAITDKNGASYFKRTELFHCRFNHAKLERVLKALDVLQERHIISHQCKLDTKKPTYIYYVNPSMFNNDNYHAGPNIAA